MLSMSLFVWQRRQLSLHVLLKDAPLTKTAGVSVCKILVKFDSVVLNIIINFYYTINVKELGVAIYQKWAWLLAKISGVKQQTFTLHALLMINMSPPNFSKLSPLLMGYAYAVWDPHYLTKILVLENVQKRAA